MAVAQSTRRGPTWRARSKSIALRRVSSNRRQLDYLPAAEGLTLDSLYVRDAAIETPRGLLLCYMGKPARAAEPHIHGKSLERAGVPIFGRIEAPGRIEGGDLVWFDAHTLAVARGYRTNAEGIRQLSALLGPSVEVITVPLPHYRDPATCSI
jgi:N-dimethylarginine dimethylaminohydrolase